MVYSENDLIFPALQLLNESAHGLSTSQLIELLTEKLQPTGQFSDIKTYEIPCKHLKPVVDALIKQGYTSRVL